MISARSRIPRRPQSDPSAFCNASGLIPQPLSRTDTHRPVRRFWTSTSIFVAPEWRNAFTTDSRPISNSCSWLAAFNARAFPRTRSRSHAPQPGFSSPRKIAKALETRGRRKGHLKPSYSRADFINRPKHRAYSAPRGRLSKVSPNLFVPSHGGATWKLREICGAKCRAI